MGKINIISDGIYLTDKKVIKNDKGNIRHIIDKNDSHFYGFSEAYFTEINKNEIKGWKKHTKMTVNLMVCFGSVEFIIYDDRNANNNQIGKYFSVPISSYENKRITIQPNIWFAFKNLNKSTSMIINISDESHDPLESINKSFEEIPLPN